MTPAFSSSSPLGCALGPRNRFNWGLRHECGLGECGDRAEGDIILTALKQGMSVLLETMWNLLGQMGVGLVRWCPVSPSDCPLPAMALW